MTQARPAAAASDSGKQPGALKLVSELYGRHERDDIYVVGTGTSLRVFPLSFLEDKITIGLNMAWKLLRVKYAITMVPHLNVPEFLEGESPRPEISWITKMSKVRAACTPEQVGYAHEKFYIFETAGRTSITGLDDPSEAGRVLDWVRKPHPEKLYLWTSISQSAVNLAANMGAKNVILVGCDNCALADDHHAHKQHTMWKGADPEVRYLQYYEGLAEMRAVLRERGVNVISVSPFLKLDDPERDFARLCDELARPQHIHNPDIARGTTLWQDNRRYIKLTQYIIKKNLRYVRNRLTHLN